MLEILKQIEQELRRSFSAVQLKEDGSASFILAENRGRAVEVSPHAGNWWLEFWEPSDDEYASPVKETTVSTPELAIEEIVRWLR